MWVTGCIPHHAAGGVQNPPGEQSKADMEKVLEEVERMAAETADSEEVGQFMWNVTSQIYDRIAAGQEFPEASQVCNQGRLTCMHLLVPQPSPPPWIFKYTLRDRFGQQHSWIFHERQAA